MRPSGEPDGNPAERSVGEGTGEPRPLVGRRAEMARLGRWLDGVVAGQGRVVLIQGEAGIGKTRVLSELARRAQQLGFGVFAGGAHELSQGQAFAAIGSVLEGGPAVDPDDACQVGREAVVRRLRQGDGPRPRLLDDVLAVVERSAMRGPVLLAVDDLHWTDASSLAALDHLARRCRMLPVAIAGTLRPALDGTDAARFRRAAQALGALELSLGPLPPGAVAELVAQLTGRRASAALLRRVGGAGGNPLYVRELVLARGQPAGVARAAPVRPADPGAESPLPSSFRRLVHDRLAGLPEDTVEMLRLASVMGSVFSVVDLVNAFGIPATRLVRSLAPALLEGVLVQSGKQLAFRHQLVRDAVYEDIPTSSRAALHLHAGRELAQAGAPAITVATHLCLGSAAGAREAVSWLEKAAADAMLSAPETSVELLDRAAEQAGSARAERERLLADRAFALVWAGRPAEAAAAAEDLVDTVSPRLEPSLRRTLSLAYVLQGRGADAAEQAERIAAGDQFDEATRALALADAAQGRVLSGELARAAELAGEGRALASRLRDELALSVATASLAYVDYFRGRLATALELAREASELALRADDPQARARPALFPLCLCLAEMGRHREAADQLARGRLASEQAGVSWHAALYHSASGRMSLLSGDWDDAIAEIETSFTVAEEQGIRWAMPQQLSYLAWIALHRGEGARADRLLERAESGFAGGAHFGMEIMAWTRALRHEDRGELPQASGLISAAWSALLYTGYSLQQLELGPDMVRLALATGDAGLAAEASAAVAAVAARVGLPFATGIALLCRGMVEGADELLLEAVGELRVGGRPIPLALACEQAAGAVARRRGRAAGVALVEEALRVYRLLGARRDLVRAQRALRALGVHRRSEAGRRPVVGWASLTDTERRVAALAASGLTNPEVGDRLFISRRTVETHLSHVFRKLGISSRVALAVAHARQEAGLTGEAGAAD